MEIGEEGALIRQPVENGSLGDRAADAEIAEADVVADDQQDVGSCRVGL